MSLEDELRDWEIVTVGNSKQQTHATIRLRMRKPRMPDGRIFGCAVEISWPYDGTNGYPDPDVNQRQLAFETALDDLSGMNGFSELFMRDLNALLAGHEPYPIEINFYEDPDWQIWSEMVDAVRSKNA